ncbi:hypothetical protein AVEN_52948-1 [Araneus ventricosus]|uniref:Uncharacterized protein n=1 Tax=Araneus ventricosus TaxID=182803 RepID=A0A4Y2SLY4_ARAVE|nr:hypothetical protein AVEN_52948-1 [Araneus ventricosus]
MQYLNFGRKYDAAEVTVDLSRLPNKNSLIQQVKIIMTRPFCAGDNSPSNSLSHVHSTGSIAVTESGTGTWGGVLSNSSHSEEESTETLEDKSLKLYEKLEKVIHSSGTWTWGGVLSNSSHSEEREHGNFGT